MMRINSLWGMLGIWWACVGLAQPLEDVSLAYQEEGVVATIRLTGPVRYLNHFPASHGETLEIFYERLKVSENDEKWMDNEVRKSPPSSLIPAFTVVTRDQQTDRPKLVVQFEREAEYSVRMGEDNRSILLILRSVKRPVSTAPLPVLPEVKPLVVPEGSLSEEQARLAEINRQAFELMGKGRDALAAGNHDAAMDAFNKLLLLPPNDYTQDAQEWVGVARERAGQPDKARVEYELYLRLYPEGEGAARVARRIDLLSGQAAEGQAGGAIVEEGGKPVSRWVSFGSVSSRYYYGRSRIDSSFLFNNSPVTSSQSLTDQSMLISTVNVSERYLSEELDARLVLNDVNMKNFQANRSRSNRLNALYGELKGRNSDYLVRVGRQSPSGAGVQSRFDGIYGSYGDARDLRVNAVLGQAADYYLAEKPRFVGASLDKGAVSAYVINQTMEGQVDRRAVGTEFRHFSAGQTFYALVDYDIYFRLVNTAQAMGTTSLTGYSLNYLIGHQRPVTLRNALSGEATASLAILAQTKNLTPEAIRKQAISRTATTNLGQVGVSVPFGDNWQFTGSLRLANTTGQMVSDTTYLPGRGLEKNIYTQLIRSSLYQEGDAWSASVGFNFGQARGSSVYLYSHTPLTSRAMLDVGLQYADYTDQLGGNTKRTSPTVQGSYQLRDTLFLDADAGLEFINYNGPTQSSRTTRYSWSLGLRWDF